MRPCLKRNTLKRNTLLLFCVSLSVMAGCDTSMVMTTSVLDRKANAFYQANDFEEALRFCNRLCKRKPDDYAAWKLRSSIHMELGNNENALEDALVAFDLKPDKVDSLKLRSHAYSANEMHEESIADWNTIIEQSPLSASNQVELGHELEQIGEYQKAIDCYRYALEINSDYAMAWNNYAALLAMSADRKYLDGKTAKRCAARAVKLADSDMEKSRAWDTFGASLARLGDFKRAQKAAKKAISFTVNRHRIREIKTRINGYKRSEPALHQRKPVHQAR